LKPEHWPIEAMYTAERHGQPVDDGLHVFIAVPIYGESASVVLKTTPSRRATCDDLANHGIQASLYEAPGESLVQRMRQRMVHKFLKSGASHMLWWDADVEVCDPTTARRMLMSGIDVVAGAYPLKEHSGRVVANLFPEQIESGQIQCVDGFIEVQDAGTGFMLVSRKAIVQLMLAYPELVHHSLSQADRGEPLWAIYDTAIVERIYLSEDYYFCHLWQEVGGKVFVDTRAKFRHWGLHGYEASIVEQYGLQKSISAGSPKLSSAGAA
jgi:hypothetical protein